MSGFGKDTVASSLILTRGYPGSGKSTWAMSLGIAEVSRDDLRMSLFGRIKGLTHADEQRITQVQHDIVSANLTANRDIVVHDTNLRERVIKDFVRIARKHGAYVHIVDFGSDVPTCKAQNARRSGNRRVPDRVIESMAERFPISRWRSLEQIIAEMDAQVAQDAPAVPEAYSGTPGRRKAFLVDLDGTLANFQGLRGPFDWNKVGGDAPFPVIVDIVDRLWDPTKPRDATLIPIFMSGRSAECRTDTKVWLSQKFQSDPVWINRHLYMRDVGDNRADEIVKKEIFFKNVAPQYDIQFALDDRDKVVKMWREIGLTCLQVAPGDF